MVKVLASDGLIKKRFGHQAILMICSSRSSNTTDQVKKFGMGLVFLFFNNENFAGVKRNALLTIWLENRPKLRNGVERFAIIFSEVMKAI